MFPVSTCKRGDRLKVDRLCGGGEFRRSMAERGVVPGVRLEVLQNGGGPLLVKVGETRLVLGCGMGRMILVSAA